MPRYTPIEQAKLHWQDDSAISDRFDDIYFSRSDALAETRYVFLEGNALPERWRGREQFVIGETGFGTALNFLVTAAEWLEHSSPSACLHYISTEKYPLNQEDLKLACQHWPQFRAIADELMSHYPPLCFGYHSRSLFGGRIRLLLLFGDANELLAQLEAAVDAWFLDGFAPSKNPQMWDESLLRRIAALTANNGTFSTFTAAGYVRRSLETTGFIVEKRAGFGVKREMLHGTLGTTPARNSTTPWYETGNYTGAKTAIIIGAGLAGASVAAALAERGWQITLIERNQQPAQEASGNLAGVVSPRLSADMDNGAQFYLNAFLHSVDYLQTLQQDRPRLAWHATGALQLLPATQRERLRVLNLPPEILDFCTAAEATLASGATLNDAAVLFRHGGWLSPPQLCEILLERAHARVLTYYDRTALRLSQNNALWEVRSSAGIIAKAPVVILANGVKAQDMSHAPLQLQACRGQLAYVHATENSRKLKMPVSYEGYVIPAYQDQHTIGASYDWQDLDSEPRPDERQQLLDTLAQRLPDFSPGTITQDRVAFRTTSQDHLPVVGPIPDIDFYQQSYADLRHGKPAAHYTSARYQPGLFVSSGHGSRGLTSCLLSAELIAAMLNNEPSPLPQDIVHALHPARFLIRQLKRGISL
ncbi:MAG: bifunctional tRNA (5-methylaminomethyl-2-thiouridine)(34)-methyltransferase MnmD/FAD-dependent 5-carboxymethylaminomethyl-2-thiouridine(34) oxidoreductase MnmC [Gammaproteobacteria bacterium]|nr:bifunctional tRNA (5-methylaminomethyl-2-thiouridine)(34)-methyltransferase MnmD/FAD-dependent 5-carboxymethylaminomethyl-2-thiouridine(34) oxidoreductase MnmC [Gammaproteobacteria bacterium]